MLHHEEAGLAESAKPVERELADLSVGREEDEVRLALEVLKVLFELDWPRRDGGGRIVGASTMRSPVIADEEHSS